LVWRFLPSAIYKTDQRMKNKDRNRLTNTNRYLLLDKSYNIRPIVSSIIL
jgi:hypothetical protein